MDGSEFPLTVEGSWGSAQNRTVRNKLQLYFQSKKKSDGGDCRVELDEGAQRASVYFSSEHVRDRVLAKERHEIILDSESVRLRLSPPAKPTDADIVSESSPDSKIQRSKVEPERGASSASKQESQSDQTDVVVSVQSVAVVLDNVSDSMTSDLLSMLVENVSGLQDDATYSLEFIREANRAVVVFSSLKDAERFLTMSPNSPKFQKHGLSARPLDSAKSVRVEGLPPTAVKDLLELYFEKSWAVPEKVVMIPEEQAALVIFSDPKVVGNICSKEDHVMRSFPIRVYPYCESLGTALYGKDRPEWKMPEPITERVHHAVWKFLLMKKHLKTINERMQPYFCSVGLDKPEVELKPLPSFLRQKGLTAQDVDNWKSKAQEAFRRLMAGYTVFECPVSPAVWKATEKDLRSAVKEDALLTLDLSRGSLIVASQQDHVKQIRDSVESIVHKATRQIERQTNGVSEVMDLSPAMFHILKQEGLLKAVQDISPDMDISYNASTKKLTISGLTSEVFKTKSWILEKNINMSKKLLDVKPCLVDFLKTVDLMDMSQDLFTSQGISAIYTIERGGVLLTGSSDGALADAEKRLNIVLCQQTLDVEDQGVLNLAKWADLNKTLLDTYNSQKKTTVAIQLHPENRDKITVVGFVNPVKEVSRSLMDFIRDHSRVRQTIRVKSYAVVEFIEKNKTEEWSSIAKTNDVTVHFDSGRPRIVLTGARLDVQKAKSSFQELTVVLFTENFIVDKPGAKKYFLSQGGLLLSSLMMKMRCVVVLRPENEEEEEEEEEEEGENCKEETLLCYCRVKTVSGVLVSVSKADICSLHVDAVVNAANEDLQHIGGLALALLKAAGPQLQNVCNDLIARKGRLQTGDAIVTDSFNLKTNYVIHAVGPRFSDTDKKTAVSRLKLAVRQSLREAEKVGCSTVALPAISSGVYGFPIDLCSQTIAQAVREYCDSSGKGSLTEVHLVDNNDRTVRALTTAVDEEFSDLRPTKTLPQHAGGMSSRGFGPGRGGHQSQFPRHNEFGERGHGQGAEAGPQGGGRSHGGPQGGGRSHGGRQSSKGHIGSAGFGGPGRVEQTTAEGVKIALCTGNIQDQTTDVIVNTISENLNLNQGAVSKALLQAAGSGLQLAVRSEADAAVLQYGEVVITKGFRLQCQKVFHTVCPIWDSGSGRAEQDLVSIIGFCLSTAEKLQMSSLSFPALGTGNLSFPRDLVSRLLLKEIHVHSSTRPRYLREVDIVIHPSDSQTMDCFTREFKGQRHRNIQHPAQNVQESSMRQSVNQSQQSSASFGPVSSPSLGVYQMQMGPLTLEVSSGDITKETSDVIVNSSNQNFTLKTGVSKAILDAAGSVVQLECAQIVNSRGYQKCPWIQTSAGQLSNKAIIHVVGQNDPEIIKDLVLMVLKSCEEQKFTSVSFPALGTGQGGASPSAVADAMIGAVVDFVRKKHPKFVRSVKILIFQTTMLAEFTRNMKQREGQEVEEKGILSKMKDTFTSWFGGSSEHQSSTATLDLEREEFEPTVFQLCSDNAKAVTLAKRQIEDLIVAEQADRTISDPLISQLSADDVDQLKALQKKLTVSITLRSGLEDQEPSIHLEGLTRDVSSAESTVRDIIRKVERKEKLKAKAQRVAAKVEWQFDDAKGMTSTFDMYTNLELEEALEKKRDVRIKINNVPYDAKVTHRKAVSADGRKEIELVRKALKEDAALPAHWEDMKGSLVKLVCLTPGTKEYQDVEQELQKTGLVANILKIERVQNETLWQNYHNVKKQLDVKNQNTNNERKLFHGTGANSLDLINTQGFNRSYAGTHAAMYGNGSYFAVDPVYSARGYAKPDAKGRKHIYLARVLVGDFAQGQRGMITPPPKASGIAADLYDSVTDNVSNPTMFIVFNDNQAYPEFLITFT